MSIGKEFGDFRARFPSCAIIAFVDLTTAMVLAADTRQKITQEKLDDLCELAFQGLTGRLSTRVKHEFSAYANISIHKCVVGHEDRIECFLRVPEPAGEALCMVLEPDCELDAVIAAGSALLKRTLVDT